MLGLLGVLGAVLSPALSAVEVREGVLPVAFALLSVALADVATRERASGLAGIVFAAPHRCDRFCRLAAGDGARRGALLAVVAHRRRLARDS